MNKILLMSGIIALAAILLVPLSPYVAKASSNCSLQGQANDKPGSHTLGSSVSSQNGSCSSAVASRAGQGSSHVGFAHTSSDPGLNTSTCTSDSTSHAGFQGQANNGQHSGDRRCSASSQSP
ncbi:MAG: hypothetical protein M3044_02350 [Thermoproteota archaeon]|nr:hypothetical protein [Thermoproteota archaeon]